MFYVIRKLENYMKFDHKIITLWQAPGYSANKYTIADEQLALMLQVFHISF